jgi:hypothetical protein
MAMLPHYQTQQWVAGICFLLLSVAGNPLTTWGNSHGEWVEKTTPDRSNWEIFCFDCGGLT